jgi:hypothetical protein
MRVLIPLRWRVFSMVAAASSEQQIMKIRSDHVSADAAENFESGLDRNLRSERKEGI